MTDFALFRLPDGRAWIGKGPFEPLAEAPPGGGAFYVNDFDLADPRPWKKPAELIPVTASTLDQHLDLATFAKPLITWTKPSTEWFKMIFRRIRREILAKRLEKMVPALSGRGTVLQGDPRRLLEKVLAPTATPTWGYAFVQGDNGFLGATPELLFHLQDRHIETMALAGTAKPGDQQSFLTDVKEIEEHEIVARFLAERLSRFGTVQREERGLYPVGNLLHFQTRLEVTATDPVNAGDLVAELHPTPAVGCLPRDPVWLERLREYRAQLQAPGFFGAPFGLAEPDTGICHLVVAIRGLSWQGAEVQVPSGCGIVGGSAFDHEWRELRLKRESVAAMLGI